jgi:hypothetical protein
MPRFNEGNSANHRYILEHINSFDYAKYYAPLLAELGYSLDFTQRADVSGMDLSDYDMILWFSGEQSTADETFNHDEQEKIAEYLESGGALFVSGAEIAWDLDYKGDSADKAFFNETLNTKYVADESGLYTFFGADGFSTVSGCFDDGTYIYQAEFADVLAPFDTDDGQTVLFYDNYYSLGAGVLTNTGNKKVFVLGFPFEIILDDESKRDLLKYVLDEFGIAPKEDPDDPVETPDDDSDSGTPDEDTADTEDEDHDQDTADTEDEDHDQDTADTGSEKPDEDRSDSSDQSDSTDASDTTDPTDSDDSADTSGSDESDETGEEKSGKKGGCSVSLI